MQNQKLSVSTSPSSPAGGRNEQQSHHFDVVIVGSGLGGLLSAVILAKEGMSVCVLEKNRQIGGCLQTFAFQKKVFDSCVHYIGGLGEGHTLNRLFRYAGIIDKLELKELDKAGFDKIAFGDEDMRYPQANGSKAFVENLLAYFPDERDALEKYIAIVKECTDHFPLYHLRNGSAFEKTSVLGWELGETLEKITSNKRLQAVLAGNSLLYAGAPGKSPFYLHALVVESYLHSAHKVVPGSSQIAKFLWKELQQLGGVIIRNAPVTRLVEESGLMNYAETASGERYFAKQFIANIHPQALLPLVESRMIRPVYRQRIASLGQTPSALMLNIVLRPQTIVHRNHNLYWHPSGEVFPEMTDEAASWPDTQAFYFTEDAANPGFSDTITILSYGDYSRFLNWADTEQIKGVGTFRNADYASRKQEISSEMLEQAFRFLPELKGNIEGHTLATPLTYRDYTAAPEGSLYGILKDVEHPAKTTIAVRTKIPNLLLTGQNVNLHGVLGVSITAVATCAELLGMDYLLEKINAV